MGQVLTFASHKERGECNLAPFAFDLHHPTRIGFFLACDGRQALLDLFEAAQDFLPFLFAEFAYFRQLLAHGFEFPEELLNQRRQALQFRVQVFNLHAILARFKREGAHVLEETAIPHHGTEHEEEHPQLFKHSFRLSQARQTAHGIAV